MGGLSKFSAAIASYKEGVVGKVALGVEYIRNEGYTRLVS